MRAFKKIPKRCLHLENLSRCLLQKMGQWPINFLSNCNWDALTILKRSREDSHFYNGHLVSDYPYLRAPKIGPLWLSVLRDNVGLARLRNLNKVPIPVDVHVAKANLSNGGFEGSI